MRWEDLLGHDQQQTWFRTAARNGRLATSFLLVGPDGIGKRCFARLIAKGLLCRNAPARELDFCNACEDCAQVDASTHPDLIQVSKPAERSELPIKLLIGEADKRMREGLCYEISLKPYAGRRKIAILDDADYLNAEGANCLLKTLEEPPTNSLLFLIGSSLQRQLPTIRSRCQCILFQPLEASAMAQLIRRGALGDEYASTVSTLSEEALQNLIAQADGSLTKARLVADEEFRDFRSQLESMLTSRQIPLTALAKEMGALVDAAGKDARARRDRMRVVFEMAAALYRRICLQAAEENLDSRAVATHIRCWNRCLQAIQEVDRNANQAALIEAWSSDLALISGR
ncbi:MAG: AAA family ATPase [bacterium]|nr:AAA family ATPase [bacterium]